MSEYPGVNKPNKIIVHHSAEAGASAQFADVNLWHKDRDFPLSTLGFYVGYQYFIEKDGSVHQARLETEGGSHTVGENFTSIGICLAGNFDFETPTLSQKLALASLIEGIIARWQIVPGSIYPHRAFKATSCYGLSLEQNWAEINYLQYKISWLKQTIAWLLGLTKH